MTDTEQQQTAAVEKEEVAPALPTTEPPKEEVEKKDEEKPAASEEKKEEGGEETKKEETKEEEKKVEEPPKDPREDPVGWIGQQIPPAVHIVNYQILDWAQKYAIEDESARKPLPGKNRAVTRNQFLGFVRDGVLLASLANKATPGAIETIHEGEAAKDKANQTANIDAFTAWAKTNLGLPEDKVLTAADLLEKGKAGYPAVFQTLWQAGLQAAEKFGAPAGIDVDSVIAAASQAVPRNILQTILSFFKRARPTPQQEKAAALEAEEKEKAEKKEANGTNGASQAVEEVIEEESQKAEAPAAPSAAPAVAAN